METVSLNRQEVPRLTADNYSVWKKRVTLVLQDKDVWDLAIANVPSPVTPQAKKASDQAKTIIGLSVSDDYLDAVFDAETAAEAWKVLMDIHEPQIAGRSIKLQRELAELCMEPEEAVDVYISRARRLYSNLKNANVPVSEHQVVTAAIAGLPARFDTAASFYYHAKDDLRFHSVQAELIQEEYLQALRARRAQESVAFSAKVNQRREARTSSGPSVPSKEMKQGGGASAPATQGPRDSRPRGPIPLCDHCGRRGHTKSRCWDLHPELKVVHDEGQAADPPRNGNLEFVFSAFADQAKTKNAWILDSGTEVHICKDRDLYNTLESRSGDAVVFGGHERCEVAGVGCVRLECAVPGGVTTVRVTEVRYVPNAAANLLSVKRLCEKGCTATFSGTECLLFQEGNPGRPILRGVSAGSSGLYILQQAKPQVTPPVNSPAAISAAAVATNTAAANLWHRRFGHLGPDNLAKAATTQMVEDLPVSAAEFTALKPLQCEACNAGKQTRVSHPANVHRATEVLELLHMDLMGPLSTPGIGGVKYIATFLDDYSRASMVRLLTTKADVGKEIVDVITLLETQTGQRVKAIRTDNGTEYVNAAISSYLSSRGILHQKSAPYTPEQNGRAERLNRTLLEKVRAMLADSGAPKFLWPEAVVTANYLRNRSPTSAGDLTPWQMLLGKKPSVGHLRVFGCPVTIKTPTVDSKVSPVTTAGIFVGYDLSTVNYRIYLPGLKRVVVTPNVRFNEVKTAGGSTAGDSPPITPETIDLSFTGAPPTAAAVTPDSLVSEVSSGEFPTVADAGTQAAALSESESGTPEPTEPPVAPVQWFRSVQRYPVRKREAPVRLNYAGRGNPTAAVVVDAGDVAASTARNDVTEPKSYEEALASPQCEEWIAAMNEEMESLQSNGTWKLEEVPAGAKTLPVKWIYKIKRDASGQIQRFKARLVVKGFFQKEGVDYTDVFAPVSKHATLRTLLSIVAAQDLELEQLDVKTAFLNGDLEEEIYMQQPPGYVQGGSRVACRLLKSIYGLKQAPRAWHLKLKGVLESMGFTPCASDPSLYIKRTPEGPIYLLVYVDDILAAGKSKVLVFKVKQELASKFDIRDLGAAAVFLGMEITRDRTARTLKLSQQATTTELLSHYSMLDAKPRQIPMEAGLHLLPALTDEDLDSAKHLPYAELIGSLLYLAVCTRPDIAYAVHALARHMSRPSEAHWNAAKGILRYLLKNPASGLVYQPSPTSLLGYTDSDYAGDVYTRRSTTGFVFIMHGAAVTWNSKLQVTVAVSSTEAEYMASASCVKEALWLRTLLTELNVAPGPLRILTDNQASLALLKNPLTSQRAKHIDVQYHFAREHVLRKEVVFEYCPTANMVADCLTKAVPRPKFQYCVQEMGLQ